MNLGNNVNPFRCILFAMLGMAGGSIGCSQYHVLDPLISKMASESFSLTAQVKFCTEPAVEQRNLLKTIVVFDKSGSNLENYEMELDGTPKIIDGTLNISRDFATDPLGHMRYGQLNEPGTLLSYLSTVESDVNDPSRYFALVEFSSGVSTFPAGSSGFTADVAEFQRVILEKSSENGGAPADDGATNYLDALNSVYNIINNDIQQAKECASRDLASAPTSTCTKPGLKVASSYVIVFMSDGSPVTRLLGVGRDSSGNIVVTGEVKIVKQSELEILARTASITALGADRQFVESINLFSIYYHHPQNIEIPAQELLQGMAEVGNGLFYDVVSGNKIDYARFEPPRKRVKYELEEVFVTNQAVVWWDDGRLYKDADGDGLPDFVETSLGWDALSRDSNGNGISDLVGYRLSEGGATLSSSDINAICQTVPRQTVSGKRVYQSSDPSGLNDCEKRILNNSGGVGNPDSNADLIPDGLQFRNNIPFQLGTSPAVHQTLQDGFSLAQKIKKSLPTAIEYQNTIGVEPSHYQLRMVSRDADQTCYDLQVSGLPSLGGQDVVRVEVIFRSELVREHFAYWVAEKAVPESQMQVEFSAEADWKKWQ